MVERNLAKVEVAGSSLVIRSNLEQNVVHFKFYLLQSRFFKLFLVSFEAVALHILQADVASRKSAG